jgi:hypothetical protein
VQWAEVEGWGNEGAIIGPLNLRKVKLLQLMRSFARDLTNASVEHFYSSLLKLRVITFLEHLSPCVTTVILLGLGVPVKVI